MPRISRGSTRRNRGDVFGVYHGAMDPMLLIALALALPPDSPARHGFPPERVEVVATPNERVQLSVSIIDAAGLPVTGLTAADVEVREAGIVRPLIDFGRESDRLDRPLSAVFLVDRSGSVSRQMGKWREACLALAAVLRPIDEVRVATFTSDLTILQDFTRDPNLLARSIAGVEQGGGGTGLFRAVDETLRDLKLRAGRKVIFVLTDGLDNERGDLWATSNDPWLADLVRRAVSSQVIVVTILPGPTGRPYMAAQDLAIQTGGWWLYTSDDLPALVRSLGERLAASYFIAYDTVRLPGDLKRRRVEVSVVRPGLSDLKVRTAEGVFGPRPLLALLAGDLEDGDEDARVLAALDLGLLPDVEGSQPLLKALKDDSPRVRAAAVTALGRRGERRAAPKIRRLLADSDPAVRAAAAQALEQPAFQ